jgi:hypothetical protein
MAECDRCGAFTDNPRDGDYHYCQDCRDTFARIRQSGVVVRGDGDYDVLVNVDGHYDKGGQEESQVDALARGKLLSDELDVDGLFEYQRTGSVWILAEYLNAHPDIQSDVSERLSRVPDQDSPGLLAKLRALF